MEAVIYKFFEDYLMKRKFEITAFILNIYLFIIIY